MTGVEQSSPGQQRGTTLPGATHPRHPTTHTRRCGASCQQTSGRLPSLAAAAPASLECTAPPQPRCEPLPPPRPPARLPAGLAARGPGPCPPLCPTPAQQWCSAVQCSAVQCSAVQGRTGQCRAGQGSQRIHQAGATLAAAVCGSGRYKSAGGQQQNKARSCMLPGPASTAKSGQSAAPSAALPGSGWPGFAR